jgi:SLT domain-containing protein
LRAVADAFAKLFTTITEDGDESTSTLQTFANALESVANGINAITRAYGKVVALGDRFRNSVVGQFVYAEGRFAPKEEARAAGGSVMANRPYRVGEFGPELFVPSGSGSIRPDNGAGQGVTIIMNGVIDGESARRSIERLLQDSSRRTGAINLVGATL